MGGGGDPQLVEDERGGANHKGNREEAMRQMASWWMSSTVALIVFICVGEPAAVCVVSGGSVKCKVEGLSGSPALESLEGEEETAGGWIELGGGVGGAPWGLGGGAGAHTPGGLFEA